MGSTSTLTGTAQLIWFVYTSSDLGGPWTPDGFGTETPGDSIQVDVRTGSRAAIFRLARTSLGDPTMLAVSGRTERSFWPDYTGDPLTFDEQFDKAPDAGPQLDVGL